MPKFFCFLVDMQTGQIDINHPTEICAKNKAEANSFLLENVPQEYIHSILSIEEFNKKFNTNIPVQKEQIQEQIITKNIQDNCIIKNNTNQIQNNIYQKPQNNIISENIQTTYFEDDGIQFKLENNILYKKTWQTIQLNNIDYRCINKSSRKQTVLPEKYQIQQFCWKQIKSV